MGPTPARCRTRARAPGRRRRPRRGARTGRRGGPASAHFPSRRTARTRPNPASLRVSLARIIGAMSGLDRYRDEFPILSRSVYMISNSLGAMPRQTARNLAEYAETWATRGVRAWEERWWEMPLEIGNKVARIIGAPAGSVSMHENVTSAHMVALSTLQPSPRRRRIVCTAMDFPSVVHLVRAQQRSGFELH